MEMNWRSGTCSLFKFYARPTVRVNVLNGVLKLKQMHKVSFNNVHVVYGWMGMVNGC